MRNEVEKMRKIGIVCCREKGMMGQRVIKKGRKKKKRKRKKRKENEKEKQERKKRKRGET